MDLNESIGGIYALLLEQMDVQKQLLSISRNKRDVIAKSDTDELESIITLEYELMSKMKLVEKRRTLEMSRLSDFTDIPVRDIKITDLISLSGSDMGAKLGAVHRELLDTIDALRDQNQQNLMLLETQLEYTDMMLNFFGGSEDPLNNFYGTDGRSSSAEITKGSTLFDTEI